MALYFDGQQDKPKDKSHTVKISRKEYNWLISAEKELLELKDVEKENELLSGTIESILFDDEVGRKEAKEKLVKNSDTMKKIRKEMLIEEYEKQNKNNWLLKQLKLWNWKHNK
jgi:hypothetical protein